MDLIPGKKVYLNHYSRKNPIVSSLVDINEENLKVFLPDKSKNIRLLKSEPIVVSFHDDKILITCEGYVKEISSDKRVLELTIDNVQSLNNKRLFERFPVSLYSTILTEKGKKSCAIVKNISLNGMAISTKMQLKEGQRFTGELYIDERVVKLNGEVAWKKQSGTKFEYGIMVSYPDHVEKNTLKLYLNILKEEQERMINISRLEIDFQ